LTATASKLQDFSSQHGSAEAIAASKFERPTLGTRRSSTGPAIGAITNHCFACFLELNRVDPQDKDKRKKINRLAEKLVECALEDKESWAFQQIADRLEGKPVQVVDATVDDRHHIEQFSDAEVTAILRKRVKVVPIESDEQRPEDEPLN
jgi:hypothetical protein